VILIAEFRPWVVPFEVTGDIAIDDHPNRASDSIIRLTPPVVDSTEAPLQLQEHLPDCPWLHFKSFFTVTKASKRRQDQHFD
jgi:hypothetical protein